MLYHPCFAGQKQKKRLTIKQDLVQNMGFEFDGGNWSPCMPFKGMDEFVEYTLNGSMRAYQVTLGDNVSENSERVLNLQKKLDARDREMCVLKTTVGNLKSKLISSRQDGRARKAAHQISSRAAQTVRRKNFRYAIHIAYLFAHNASYLYAHCVPPCYMLVLTMTYYMNSRLVILTTKLHFCAGNWRMDFAR
jgi:hypothetical protein